MTAFCTFLVGMREFSLAEIVHDFNVHQLQPYDRVLTSQVENRVSPIYDQLALKIVMQVHRM